MEEKILVIEYDKYPNIQVNLVSKDCIENIYKVRCLEDIVNLLENKEYDSYETVLDLECGAYIMLKDKGLEFSRSNNGGYHEFRRTMNNYRLSYSDYIQHYMNNRIEYEFIGDWNDFL